MAILPGETIQDPYQDGAIRKKVDAIYRKRLYFSVCFD
jgi:hypothetical protein